MVATPRAVPNPTTVGWVSAWGNGANSSATATASGPNWNLGCTAYSDSPAPPLWKRSWAASAKKWNELRCSSGYRASAPSAPQTPTGPSRGSRPPPPHTHARCLFLGLPAPAPLSV